MVSAYLGECPLLRPYHHSAGRRTPDHPLDEPHPDRVGRAHGGAHRRAQSRGAHRLRPGRRASPCYGVGGRPASSGARALPCAPRSGHSDGGYSRSAPSASRCRRWRSRRCLPRHHRGSSASRRSASRGGCRRWRRSPYLPPRGARGDGHAARPDVGVPHLSGGQAARGDDRLGVRTPGLRRVPRGHPDYGAEWEVPDLPQVVAE